MIKTLAIQNFQSHQDTVLEFDNGVNLITGQSDSGKTAILRALNWVINNKPAGDSFRSNWGGDTGVALVLDNGKVFREKGKKNLYRLGKTLFESFGQDVPEEISKAINVKDINFQQQLDAPFLLSNSSGEVARQLNDIVDLMVIDTSLFNIGKMIRQNNQSLNAEKTQLENLQTELEKYNYLDQLEKDIGKIEKQEQIREESNHSQVELIGLLVKAGELQTEIKDTEKILKAEGEVRDVELLIDQKDVWIEQMQGIQELGTTISHKAKAMQEISAILLAEKQMDSLLMLIEKQEETARQSVTLNSLMDKICDEETGVVSAEDRIYEMENEYDSTMPERCPLCGQEIKS